MGYLVHGRLDAETISVRAKDAHDAAKQASELVKRGAHEIRIKDEEIVPLGSAITVSKSGADPT